MEQFKHSCPHCGQHLEYTRNYCGKSVTCPTCGNLVMFPAIPPGGNSAKLRLAKDVPKPKKKFEFKFGAILANLFTFGKGFEHWKVVGFCLLPFVIIGVALIAAAGMKRHQADAATTANAPATTQVDAGTWDKIENLAQEDQRMQSEVEAVKMAQIQINMAAQNRNALDKIAHGQPMDQYAMRAFEGRCKEADQQIAIAQQMMAAKKQQFAVKFANYQRLGGKVDYMAQIPK